MIRYIFPAIMITLNLCQCVVMLMHRSYINALYWIAAAVLNLTVAIK